MQRDGAAQQAFLLFKEITILSQLAAAEFNRMLPGSLHVSHFSIIEHLTRCGHGQTPQDLARVFQMSKQNMTNSIAQLRNYGFVEVHNNPNDGRSKIVRLTEDGHAFRNQAMTALVPMLSDVAAHDAFAELTHALPALQTLREFLDARRQSDTRTWST
ncbi:MAG: MarR family winged helix-turn-helix transcriptional regulator [Pseudomonadota bacterium]